MRPPVVAADSALRPIALSDSDAFDFKVFGQLHPREGSQVEKKAKNHSKRADQKTGYKE